MRRRSAMIVVVTAAVAAYASLTAVAQAAVQSTAFAVQSASSASWKLVPSTTTSPAGTGTAMVTGSVLTGAQYLYVVNTGTATLGSGFTATYAISASGLGLGYMNLNACTGTWNEATGACTGGTLQLLASTSVAQTPMAAPPMPATPNATLRLQVSFVGVSVLASGTVSASVSRTAGAGRTTTS